jgi:hypothetical protein
MKRMRSSPIAPLAIGIGSKVFWRGEKLFLVRSLPPPLPPHLSSHLIAYRREPVAVLMRMSWDPMLSLLTQTLSPPLPWLS